MRKRALHRLYRFTPFAELSQRRRRDLYVSLRWKIMRDARMYGGKFTSHLMLDEPGRPRLYNQDFSFYFLGNDGFTIWNTRLFTATYEFWHRTSSLASERAFSLLSDEQQKQEGRLEFEGSFIRDGEKYYTMATRPEQAYDCFGGLTLREYTKKSELEIIENEPPVIYESFMADPTYEYGIGLRAIVQADEINREVIEATIDKFRQMGEHDWESGQPVPRGVLPIETKETALSKIKYPHVEGISEV